MMSVFRTSIEQAGIDAPIAELVCLCVFHEVICHFQLVVSISALDLNRWYAFQCYMKAMDVFDADMHLECDFSNPGQVRYGKDKVASALQPALPS